MSLGVRFSCVYDWAWAWPGLEFKLGLEGAGAARYGVRLA